MTLGHLKDNVMLAARAVAAADRKILATKPTSDQAIESMFDERQVALRRLRLAVDELELRERAMSAPEGRMR